jgi:hypothetical protein
MHRDEDFDRQLRDAILAEPVDTAALDNRIRERTRFVTKSVARGKWIAAIGIAAILTLAIGGYFLFPNRSVVTCQDAVRDHRIEVVDGSQRKWLSDASEIKVLAAKQGLPLPAPQGYRLERGKLCRLGGHVFLHLVYSDGSHEASLYLRDRGLAPSTGMLIDGDVALAEGARFTAVAVSSSNAAELARFAARMSS